MNTGKTLLDIGTEIPSRNNEFMRSIMAGDIADSGLDSTGDPFFEYSESADKKMTEAKFEELLRSHGIGIEEYRAW